jgi:hypothetical protein
MRKRPIQVLQAPFAPVLMARFLQTPDVSHRHAQNWQCLGNKFPALGL